MKSEERHRLHTHELRRLARQLGEFWGVYGNRVLLGVLTVALAGALVWYLMQRAEATSSAGWADLRAGVTAEDFGNVADKHPGTKVGTRARLLQAENHLYEGVQSSFVNRSAAVDELKQAREAFEKVLNTPALTPAVRERALFGMARCLETLVGVRLEGNGQAVTTQLDEAAAAYQRLLDEFPDTVYRDLAERRISALRADALREFYAWFRDQDPRPEDRPQPRDFGGFDFPPGHGDLMQEEGPFDSLPEDSPFPPAHMQNGADAAPADPDAGFLPPTLTIPSEEAPAEETPAEESADGAPPADGARPPAEASDPGAEDPESPLESQ